MKKILFEIERLSAEWILCIWALINALVLLLAFIMFG